MHASYVPVDAQIEHLTITSTTKDENIIIYVFLGLSASEVDKRLPFEQAK